MPGGAGGGGGAGEDRGEAAAEGAASRKEAAGLCAVREGDPL